MIIPFFALALALQPPAPAASVDRLSWLAGCWVQTTKDGSIEEQWMAPGGGIMMGMSRTVQNGRTVSYEFVRIAPMSAGSGLFYIISPTGQAPVAFPLKSMSDREVVFENAAREFPQRLTYRRNADGTVTSRTEGESGGRTVSQEFPYQRCK